MPLRSYVDSFGNHCQRLLAPAGVLRLQARGLVADSGRPDPVLPELQQRPVDELPDEVLGEVRRALVEFKVLFFRDQDIDVHAQSRFAARFDSCCRLFLLLCQPRRCDLQADVGQRLAQGMGVARDIVGPRCARAVLTERHARIRIGHERISHREDLDTPRTHARAHRPGLRMSAAVW